MAWIYASKTIEKTFYCIYIYIYIYFFFFFFFLQLIGANGEHAQDRVVWDTGHAQGVINSISKAHRENVNRQVRKKPVPAACQSFAVQAQTTFQVK